MITVKDFIAEARTWLNTPFHHQGRVKGVGADCIGIFTGTLKALDLLQYDNTNYTRDPDSDKLVRLCDRYLIEIPVSDATIGCILMMSWRKGPQHLALLTDVGILHAHIRAKKVVEHVYDETWQKRTVKAYKVPGINYEEVD